MSQSSPDVRAVVRAADALTTQVRRIADALTTPADGQSTTADDGPCPQHPHAPVIGGHCGGCTVYPADMRPAPAADEDRPAKVIRHWGPMSEQRFEEMRDNAEQLADWVDEQVAKTRAADEDAPYLLRVLVDRAVRGVLSLPGEGEALHRRTEQMINGRAAWKAKAEEIERDRDRIAADLEQARAELHRHAEADSADAAAGSYAARAEQAEELLRIAHETSNRSEAERARAVQRADIAETELRVLRAGLRAAGGDPTQIQNLWAQIRLRNRQWRETKRERDQLAATLREVLGLFSPASLNGMVAFYQATEHPIAPEDYERWRSVVAPTVERPWWQQLDAMRAELVQAQAQAANERVRKALNDRPPILNAEGQGVSDYETGWRDHDRMVRAALDGTEQPTTEA